MSKELVPLGQLIEGEAYRDAIHIAIEPLVAPVLLQPGQEIDRFGYPQENGKAVLVGIVDPYLKHPVLPGQRFYLCLFPNTVTSLRHYWKHPAFTIGQ